MKVLLSRGLFRKERRLLLRCEQIVAAINRLRADTDSGHVRQRLASVPDESVGRVLQIGVEPRNGNPVFVRIGRRMIEERLVPRFAGEPDDDAEHVCLVRSLVVPPERVVREVDVDTQVVQGFPEVGDLLALTYRVGRDQGAARALPLREPRGLHVPGPAVVDVARVLRAVEDLKEFGLLLLGLVAGPKERRVAHEVREVIGEHLGPIGLEGVALMEVAKAPERQEVEVITDVYLLRLSEHLLLGDPKGGLGDRDGEVVYLDAVQLIERYADGAVLRNDEGRLPCVAGLLAELVFDDSVLDGAQLPVRLGKEVARAACRVADGNGGNLVVQPRQGLLALRRRPLTLGLVQLVPQLVEEQRPEAALDVLNARVVHAPGMARLGIQSPLEHAAEDDARDLAPVEVLRGVGDGLKNFRGHLRDDDGGVGEQPTVHVGEGRKVLVHVLVPLVQGSIDGLEQIDQFATELRGVSLAVPAERLMRLQEIGVLGVK